MNYIISYDISEDKIRLKVANELLRAGCRRLQKSVFMAVDFKVKDIRQLKSDVLTLMDVAIVSPDNSIICLPVSKKQKVVMWWQPPSSDPIPEKDWSAWF